MLLHLCFIFTFLEVLALIETILNLCLVVMVHKHKENISVPYKTNSTQSLRIIGDRQMKFYSLLLAQKKKGCRITKKVTGYRGIFIPDSLSGFDSRK